MRVPGRSGSEIWPSVEDAQNELLQSVQQLDDLVFTYGGTAAPELLEYVGTVEVFLASLRGALYAKSTA